MTANRSRIAGTLLAAIVVAGSAAPGTASARPHANAASATVAHTARQYTTFRGRVSASDRSHGWFMMRTTTHQNVRIYATAATYWHGCDWGNMGHGYHVQVRAYRTHGHWMASRMQNWGQWGDRGWGDMPGWSHDGWGGPMMG